MCIYGLLCCFFFSVKNCNKMELRSSTIKCFKITFCVVCVYELLLLITFYLHKKSKVLNHIYMHGHVNDGNTNICNPTYMIIGESSNEWNDVFLNRLHLYGFTIECNENELNTFIENREINQFSSAYVCKKYNNYDENRNQTAKIFCNGGRIHCDDNNYINSDALHIFQSNLNNKVKLHQILNNYCNINFINHNKNICDFKLLSYSMDNEKNRIEFLNKYINCSLKSENQKIWVLKENKNGGDGIHLIHDFAMLYHLIMPSLNYCNMSNINNINIKENDTINDIKNEIIHNLNDINENDNIVVNKENKHTDNNKVSDVDKLYAEIDDIDMNTEIPRLSTNIDDNNNDNDNDNDKQDLNINIDDTHIQISSVDNNME
eukprot:532975_1